MISQLLNWCQFLPSPGVTNGVSPSVEGEGFHQKERLGLLTSITIGETGPLETGGDFYNSFVLGFLPASFESEDDEVDDEVVERAEPSATSTQAATPTSTPTNATRPPAAAKWANIAYPKPDLAQDGLGQSGGGVLSAYFLKDASIAVLSIPSFSESDEGIDMFSAFVGTFIKTSKSKGMKKVVIDLQRNLGGDALLATDMYRQFFPTEEQKPFGGSRMRGHGPANIMGKTLTEYWATTTEEDPDHFYLYSNEWVALTRINTETKQNFTSWEEFYGPHVFNGGDFTTTVSFKPCTLDLIFWLTIHSNDIISPICCLILWQLDRTKHSLSMGMAIVP